MARSGSGKGTSSSVRVGALVALTLIAPLACSNGGDSTDQVTSRSVSTGPTTSVAPASTVSAGPTSSPDDPQETAPADVLVVDCDGEGAGLSTNAVQVQPDGIHVTVRNTTDDAVVVNFVDRGDIIEPGSTETVQEMAPGPLVVSCGYDKNSNIVVAGTVDAVDPDGIWQQTSIDCSRLPLAGWDEPMGVGSTPEDAVRWWLTERPEALVRPIPAESEIASVGYPESASPIYVTRTGGRDADIFRLEQVGGTWHATPHEGCPRP